MRKPLSAAVFVIEQRRSLIALIEVMSRTAYALDGAYDMLSESFAQATGGAGNGGGIGSRRYDHGRVRTAGVRPGLRKPPRKESCEGSCSEQIFLQLVLEFRKRLSATLPEDVQLLHVVFHEVRCHFGLLKRFADPYCFDVFEEDAAQLIH